jgi:hypothetical protein
MCRMLASCNCKQEWRCVGCWRLAFASKSGDLASAFVFATFLTSLSLVLIYCRYNFIVAKLTSMADTK